MKRVKRKLPPFLHGPVSALVRSLVSVPLVLGLTPSLRIACALGRRYAELSFNRKRLARAHEHLREAFPDWDEERRRALAVRAYEHLFQLAVETAFAPRLITRDAWLRHVALENVAHGIREMVRNEPCVLITGHVGNWELIGYSVAMLGFPVRAVYRPLDMKPMDRWLRETRERRGLVLVSKFGAIRDLPEALDARLPVGFVADQNGGDRGVFAPFFGRLTSSYKSIAFLAMRHNARIACGFARRLAPGETLGSFRPLPLAEPEGMRFVFEVTDIFGPEDWRESPDPVFYISARYRRAIEAMVRRAPEQYLWMHRIWRSRPPHERFDKPFPAALREKLRSLPWMTEEELARIEERSERDRAALRAGA